MIRIHDQHRHDRAASYRHPLARTLALVLAPLGCLMLAPSGLCAVEAPAEAVSADLPEVLVYPTVEDGSVMHWLAISPLQYDVAYLGDSLSADVLGGGGHTELTIRPRAGDAIQGKQWKKMHFSGTTVGPTMADLFQVANYSFDFAITCVTAYIYSPTDHPNAIFSGSADDALKVVLNGRKIWTNQIQRSPTYDSDRCPAPLMKGWNTAVLTVDQAIGGHLVCTRFLDGDKPITDLEIALDPPAAGAKRHPAEAYNKAAAEAIRTAEAANAAGKLADAIVAYDQVLSSFPLADVAPRAAYAKALIHYDPSGKPSQNDPKQAIVALTALLDRYRQDLLAEYALYDLATIQEVGLKDGAAAEATYRSFESRYPSSSLVPKALVAVARLQAQGKHTEESILTYRKVISKFKASDEVMTATLGIADAYRLAGEKDKAKQQYDAAKAMAQDWHDNKYGIDVGKQAWLETLIGYAREQAAALAK